MSNPWFKRILVPVDFSAGSTHAVRYGARLAQQCGADLILMHVAPREVSPRGAQSLAEAVRQFADAAEVDFAVRVVLRYGTVAQEILLAARHYHTDLILMTTRSLGGTDFLLSSTARTVLRYSPGAVLTLTPRGGGQGGGASRWPRVPIGTMVPHGDVPLFPPRHVLYLWDGNTAALRTLDVLRHLARICRPSVTLLAAGIARSKANHVALQLSELAADLRALAGADLTVDRRVLTEEATRTLIAMSNTVDLMMLGRNWHNPNAPPPGWMTRARPASMRDAAAAAVATWSGRDDHLLGALARHVHRRAECPVLSLPTSRLESVERRMRRVFGTMTEAQLSQSSAEGDWVMADLQGQTNPLLLGVYGDQGLMQALRAHGFIDLLEAKGFADITIELETKDPSRQQVRARSNGDLLAEVVLSRGHYVPTGVLAESLAATDTPLSVLQIHWVMLQNPRTQFSATRPAMPGQRHPGLGMGYEMAELLVLIGERLRLDALLTTPQYYHNASLYHERFHFADPDAEGQLLALQRDTAGHSFVEVSWAIHLRLVRDQSGAVLDWRGHPQLLPLRDDLRGVFDTGPYRAAVRTALERYHFTVDWAALPPPSAWPDLLENP